jgi:hypothetical protein
MGRALSVVTTVTWWQSRKNEYEDSVKWCLEGETEVLGRTCPSFIFLHKPRFIRPACLQNVKLLLYLWNFPEIGSSLRVNCRSQWPLVLRRRSTAARLLRSWVRIPPGVWMFVCCVCCVLSGRGLCDELITRPEEFYRLWQVVVCDHETSWTRRP